MTESQHIQDSTQTSATRASERAGVEHSAACSESQELLPWFVNGSLSPQEHSEVRGHLVRCAACRGEYRRLAGLMEALAQTRVSDSEPLVNAAREATGGRVLQGAFVPRAQRETPSVPTRSAWIRPSLLAAALIGAFGLGSLLTSPARLDNLSVPDQIAADQNIQPTPPTAFDGGFESGDLDGWTLFDSIDGPSGTDEKSQPSQGDPS